MEGMRKHVPHVNISMLDSTSIRDVPLPCDRRVALHHHILKVTAWSCAVMFRGIAHIAAQLVHKDHSGMSVTDLA